MKIKLIAIVFIINNPLFKTVLRNQSIIIPTLNRCQVRNYDLQKYPSFLVFEIFCGPYGLEIADIQLKLL